MRDLVCRATSRSCTLGRRPWLLPGSTAEVMVELAEVERSGARPGHTPPPYPERSPQNGASDYCRRRIDGQWVGSVQSWD